MNALDFPLKYYLSASDKARLFERARKQGHTPDAYVETLIKRDIFAAPPPDPEPSARHVSKKKEGAKA